MSKPNHSFNVQIAEKYGVHAAILYNHFYFWIEFNHTRKKHSHDGRVWTFGSYLEIATHFSYLSDKKVRTAIDKLVENGVIIKGNYNKTTYDNTNWYAFKDQKMFTVCPNGQADQPKRAEGSDQKGRPIPDTKKDTKKNNNRKPAAAVVFDCLEKEDIPQEEKEWISSKYNEEQVQRALRWTKHPETKITKTFLQALKWACDKQPEIKKAPKDVTEEHKKVADRIAFLVPHERSDGYRIEVLNKCVLIYAESGSGATTNQFDYDKINFKEKIWNFIKQRMPDLAQRLKTLDDNQ